jgi:hypothetical protein
LNKFIYNNEIAQRRESTTKTKKKKAKTFKLIITQSIVPTLRVRRVNVVMVRVDP